MRPDQGDLMISGHLECMTERYGDVENDHSEIEVPDTKIGNHFARREVCLQLSKQTPHNGRR